MSGTTGMCVQESWLETSGALTRHTQGVSRRGASKARRHTGRQARRQTVTRTRCRSCAQSTKLRKLRIYTHISTWIRMYTHITTWKRTRMES